MNASEDKVKKDFEDKGYTSLRCGSPDFVFYKENDLGIYEVKFVEVKRNDDEILRKEQAIYKKILEFIGADYELISPNIKNENNNKIKSISFDYDVLKEVDKRRGDVNLSISVNKLLREALKGGKKK